jgi:putative ABC transport system ATP-binding protein
MTSPDAEKTDGSVVLREVSRSFVEGGRRHAVLVHASAAIASGEIAAITGRSGSGKSTLLNLIGGLDDPDSGEVIAAGRALHALREPERTRFRRAHVGFVHQFFNLIPTLDAEENVRLALELNGVRGPTARQRSAELLGEVGLGERLRSAIDRLSGGEQQRVAIARALVHRPRLVLADEPTGSLDAQTADEVLALLIRMVRTHAATLLIVTHDPEVAARADRVLELRDGALHEVQR